MSDLRDKLKALPPDDRLNLTQTIKKLSMPTEPANDPFEEEGGTALLLCRDAGVT